MKKLVVALAALALSAPAFAQSQQPAGANGGQFGLGISITPDADPAPTIEVYVPFQIAPTLRLEPSLGIATVDAPQGGTDTKDITLGVGLFVTQKVAPAVNIYGGGRLKLNFASFDNGATDDSGTDFILAAAAGGEYFFVPKFSIGLEGQLGFYSQSETSGDNSGFFTTGLGFLRVYF
jgi:hypothetical protein